MTLSDNGMKFIPYDRKTAEIVGFEKSCHQRGYGVCWRYIDISAEHKEYNENWKIDDDETYWAHIDEFYGMKELLKIGTRFVIQNGHIVYENQERKYSITGSSVTKISLEEE